MKSLFYVFTFTILFSCNSNKNSEILNYTTDATLGLSRVNLNSISDKIPVDKILKEKKDLKEDEKFFLQLVSKPKESGIDTDKPLYFIVDQGKSTYDPDAKAFFWINDKVKFQKSMSDLTKSKVTVDAKDYIYVDGKITGSIKGDMAIVSTDKSYNPYVGYNSLNTPGVDSSKLTEKYFTDFWARKGTSSDAIKDQVNQSLINDKDISGWVNLAAVASYASKGYIETLAVNKLIKDSGIGFDFNFDKGKSEMETKTFFNNDMKKVVEKYYDKNKVNYDLVKNVELDNAKSFTIGFFSLDFMKYLVKEAGFEATINHYLSSTNKTLEDITSTFTGDYAFVDFKPNPADSTEYYLSNTALVLGFNPKKKDNLISLLAGPLGQSKKYMIADNEVLFSEDNNIIYQFQNKKAGKNAKLDKKSGVTSYSWSNGSDYNQKHDSTVKVVDMTNESKEDGGNLVSKTVFTLDKKDENALYYLIMNG
ncbi:hypothetical protein QFZ37_000785 [Chryseobacterium ginsenosidimutans]|uniref:hypothetical protein n=1 Tax=Chryseobacterium ginsenosidimutans TaxID=687846 RepID=UPI002781056F|nr:hypothetical protein [Chryseobacterium ginsenosidimutans]MDQ0592416.1 hypothetical protein [Chryseobacterium ginsenosidimutans]